MAQNVAVETSAYDGSGNPVESGVCLQHLRCWRCWKAFHVPIGYGGVEESFLYRCHRCDAVRALDGIDYLGCFWRYIKQLDTIGERIAPIEEKHYRRFDREFQKRWALRCGCGGIFEARWLKLFPKCTHCGMPNLGWLPWPMDEDVTFLKLPALIYAIPAEYQHYDTSEPAWLVEQSQQMRVRQAQETDERLPEWLRVALVLLAIGVIFGIWKIVELIMWVFGALTNTNQFVKPMRWKLSQCP